ncbi:zonular occludens toxin [Vibrio sp. 03-59-1]|uniref:zonular occludens toxin domain-containing protein n=1 Tax=Vibrio sp. 03-59-1 TaxID=2607607 RepID=UPI0014937453|nr:zonular occludens toxin domain-containing protein [Vibrio sp. 03-59-1]NOH83718.1 zonular occludens toxin [Vibrio sp. 03-59-1]
MIYLRTGLPGASKTLNSLREIVLSHDSGREYYYTNIKLLMLDIDVACSFSGWYYGWYFPNLKDKASIRKLSKIMKPIHDDGEFITLNDVPWLRSQYDSHNHFETWLYWVRRVYPKKKLEKLESILDAAPEDTQDKFDLVRPLNLDFRNFPDPNDWSTLPKRSVILVDEVQQFFPPRGVGSRVPKAIAALETHRHGGYDLHFVTQDRTLCDANLRKLVGRHVHYFNALGGKNVTRKEAPKCFDPNDYHQSQTASKKMISHDKKFYGVYWSAEIHTHKFKFPFMGFVAIFFFCLILYSAYSLSSQLFDGSDSSSPAAPTQPTPIQTDSPDITENPVADFVDELLTDVYISGSVVEQFSDDVVYHYTFVRSSDGAVFYPEAMELTLDPLTPCLANIRIGELIRPVTCNPFYVRDSWKDEDIEDSEDGQAIASAESSEKYKPNIKLF